MPILIRIILLVFSIGTVISCGNDSGLERSGFYNIQIDYSEVVVFDDASIKIGLYGTDRTVSGNSATLISESILNLREIPSNLSLRWPDNDYQLIDSPPVRAEEDAVYYFSLAIDSNNDGLLCDGDYRQDYDMTPFFTLAGIPIDVVLIHVNVINNGTCVEF